MKIGENVSLNAVIKIMVVGEFSKKGRERQRQ
jgi:hypothetical protein